MALTLYRDQFCPYSQRVFIALLELDINHDIVEIDQTNIPDWYVKGINPAGTLPALKLADGTILVESLGIVQYLLDEYGDQSLLVPKNSVCREPSRLFVDYFDKTVAQDIINFITVKDAEEKKVYEEKLLAHLPMIDAKLTEISPTGPYATGIHFTHTDIALAPWLVRIANRKDFVIPDTEELLRFNSWFHTVTARQSVQDSIPPAE